MSKPTARPWHLFETRGGVLSIMDANGNEIVHWSGFDASHFPLAVQRKNARLIVAAVNRATFEVDLSKNLLSKAERWGLRDVDRAKGTRRRRRVTP